MIVISAAGVATAILLLVVGMITSSLLFVYISIGVGVAAALLFAAGVFTRRDLFAPGMQKAEGAAAGPAKANVSPQAARAGVQTAGDVAAERTAGKVLAGTSHGAFRTSPSAAASGAPEPEAVEPEDAEPEAAEPEPAEPEAVKPEDAEPEAAEPEPAEPGAAEPEPAEPDAAEPQAVGPKAARPDAGTPAEAGVPAATVWVVRGVSRHHLRDCVLVHVVDDDDVDTMTLAAAEALRCIPCKACHTG